jgi:hypothetical protein
VLELLLLLRRVARHVAVAEDVDGVVVVVGTPCFSQRLFVVWARRMKMTSFLIRQPKVLPSRTYGGEVSIHGRDVYLAFYR